MSGEKRAIRQQLRRERRCLPCDQVEEAGVAVSARLRRFAPFVDAASVLAYHPTENEIPIAALLADVAASGRVLYLPRLRQEVEVVRWRPGDTLVCGRDGVPEPDGPADELLVLPAIALVPLVGWDSHGTRLGRGGGFYDRLFARLADGSVRVGLGYEFQEYEGLPRDSWDVPLHYVITERRIVACGNTGRTHPTLLQKGGLQL